MIGKTDYSFVMESTSVVISEDQSVITKKRVLYTAVKVASMDYFKHVKSRVISVAVRIYYVPIPVTNIMLRTILWH